MTRNARDVILAGLFALAVLYTLFFARAFLLPVAMAVLLTLILSPAAGALARLRIPMPAAAGIVVTLMLLVLGTAIYRLAAPAADWIKKAPEALGQLEDKLRPVKASVGQVTKTAEKIERAVTPGDSSAPAPKAAAPAGTSIAAKVASFTQTFAVSALATVVLLFFLLASGDMFLQKLVRVMPTLKDKKKAVEVARTIQSRMATYLFTITAINTVVAIVVSTVLWALGMPNPVLWGVLAGLLNYIPVLGPATVAVIFSAVAALSFDSLGEAARVPAAYLVLHLLEGQLISPVLTGRNLSLNPVVIFLGVLFWGWLWGILGALMAVPILMAVKIVCDNVESLSTVSEFLSAKQESPTQERESIPSTAAE